MTTTKEYTPREQLVMSLTDRLTDWLLEQVDVENAAIEYGYRTVKLPADFDTASEEAKNDRYHDMISERAWEYRQSLLLDVLGTMMRVYDHVD